MSSTATRFARSIAPTAAPRGLPAAPSTTRTASRWPAIRPSSSPNRGRLPARSALARAVRTRALFRNPTASPARGAGSPTATSSGTGNGGNGKLPSSWGITRSARTCRSISMRAWPTVTTQAYTWPRCPTESPSAVVVSSSTALWATAIASGAGQRKSMTSRSASKDTSRTTSAMTRTCARSRTTTFCRAEPSCTNPRFWRL